MSEVNTKGKIDEISLDASLDDIDDLPSFSTYPSGAHIVLFDKWEQKKVNDANWINVDLKLISSEEITEVIAEFEKPKEGDVQTMGHNQTNSFAMGALKSFLAPIALKAGIDMKAPGALRAALDAGKGMQLLIIQVRTPRLDANDKPIPDKWNARIKNVEVL